MISSKWPGKARPFQDFCFAKMLVRRLSGGSALPRGQSLFPLKNISPHPLRRRMGGLPVDWIDSPQNHWFCGGPMISSKWPGKARPFQDFCFAKMLVRRLGGGSALPRRQSPFPSKKTFPPIRSVGEWGAYPLIGLSIGPYLLLSKTAVRMPGWGNGKLGSFQSLKQLCTQIFALVDYQNALVWLIIVSVFRLWGLPKFTRSLKNSRFRTVPVSQA